MLLDHRFLFLYRGFMKIQPRTEPALPEPGQVPAWQQAKALQLRQRRRQMDRKVRQLVDKEDHDKAIIVIQEIEHLDAQIDLLES